MRWLDGTTDSVELGQTPGDGEGQEARVLQCVASHRVRPDFVTEEQKAGSNAALCSGTVFQWHSVFGAKTLGICSLCLWFLLHACHFERTEFWSSSDLF